MEAGQDYSDDYDGPGLDSYKTQIIVPKTYGGQEVRVCLFVAFIYQHCPQEAPPSCLLTPWSSWSRPHGQCGLERLERNRACMEDGVMCSDQDCGYDALYEESKVRISF